MLKWLDASRSKLFGAELGKLVIASLPVRPDATTGKTDRALAHTLRSLDVKVSKFRETERLNFFKIAQLCNSFKWVLLDAQFPQDRIDDLVSWLVGRLKT